MIFAVLAFVFVAIVVLLVAAEYGVRLTAPYKLAKSIPGPEVMTWWTTLKFIYSLTPATTFDLPRAWALEFKQSYQLWMFFRMAFNVCRAREMEIILASSKHNQKGATYDVLRPFLGDGLLISIGNKWMQRRRILTPAFHFTTLQQFLPVFRVEGVKLTNTLESRAAEKETNLLPLMSKFTLNTICETSMGVKLDAMDEADEYRRNLFDIGEMSLERFLKPWLQVPRLYDLSAIKQRMDAVLKPAHSFTRNVIRKRRQTRVDRVVADSKPPSDNNLYQKRRYAMLDTLLSAESRGEIDEEGIREEVDTFMFEGHDTTSAALTFIFLLLALHPDVQERVYEEIQKVVAEANDQELSTADYNEMTYTDRVIKECMRLYPPVPFISRSLTEPVTLEGGQVIPADTMCYIHIFDLHRDPEQFPDPEKFDPARFELDECKKRHPFAYLPFSAGPRNCIGQKYAMLEMKSCLEQVLTKFKLTPVTQREDIVFVADIVLRTKTPVKVQFNLR